MGLFSKLSKHARDFTNDLSGDDTSQKPLNGAKPNVELFQCDKEGSTSSSADQTARPISIKGVKELGNVTSTSTCVKRDLGFQGKLGKHILLTYGDTMYSKEGGNDEFRGMTCNSVAIASDNPTRVHDPLLNNDGWPHCFLQPSKEYNEDPSVNALGITNVIETRPGEGILYFLLNHRPDGKDNLLGAGVAEVTINSSLGSPVPKVKRHGRFWWDGDTEPWYGDVCALKAGNHVYAYGHAKDNPWIYVTRAPLSEATNLEAYEYWNGESWQKERLQLQDLNEKQSVFWQVNQGQVIWSSHHNCFLFIYCDKFWSCQVLVKTAPAPEGPWSEPITVYKPTPIQEGGNVYTAIPHPYYDNSGQTLVITYTNHPNTIQAIQVVSIVLTT